MADTTTKPVEPVVPETIPAAVTEPTPAVAEPTTETAAPAETTTEAAAPVTEAAAEPAAATEEKKEPAKKEVEPITSGVLGYKQPGFPKNLLFSKKYFWVGDEPVAEKSLAHYLRGEKPDVANATAAWSSVTGKGLLYFAKKVDTKETPAGVLNLAEAEGITKVGYNEFSFTLHGHKHVFEAKTADERNGWLLAIEKAVEEATGKKEEITTSQGYKDMLEKLSKPLAVGAAGATAGAAAPKAEASTSTPAKETAAEPAEGLTRAGSASSESDVENKKKKSKSKSRSVSRGKRASIFGSLLGKKEDHEAKKEEKEEAKKEEPKTEEVAAAVAADPVAAAAPTETAAPATTEATPAVAAEETKPTETPATETAAETSAPKPTKRASVFRSVFEKKVKSPTTEKTESEVAPAAPPKDEPVAAAAAAAPAVAATEETPAAETETAAAETKPAETTEAAAAAPTPKKEKENFFSKLIQKAKSPTSETAPKLDEPKKSSEVLKETEAPAAATTETAEVAPAVPEKTEPEVPAAAATETEAPKADAPKTEAPTTERRKSSFLANFTGGSKKEKAEGETSPSEKKLSTLGGIFRNPSKAIRGNKEAKKEASTPAKVEEAGETSTAPVITDATAPAIPTDPTLEGTPAAEPATGVTKSIGDVVPEAVTVGTAPESSPAVKAAA